MKEKPLVSTTMKTLARRPVRQYSEQFKAEAVRMVTELGKPASEVARELDVHPASLYSWLKKDRESKALDAGTSATQVAELESEVKRLKMENEFLKKAAAFFAKESP
jgi:transposase-like protein